MKPLAKFCFFFFFKTLSNAIIYRKKRSEAKMNDSDLDDDIEAKEKYVRDMKEVEEEDGKKEEMIKMRSESKGSEGKDEEDLIKSQKMDK